MNRCDMELCPYWTGDGCACAVLGIEREAADATAGTDGEDGR